MNAENADQKKPAQATVFAHLFCPMLFIGRIETSSGPTGGVSIRDFG